jgi:hypothetical protein
MAIRPVVLVYQEIASPTVTPTTPDLNCLVVGPAYYIQDYFQPGTTTYADKANIQVSTPYGTYEGDPTVATPVGPGYIVVAEPPNNPPGALLDDSSVEIFFDQAQVVIASGTDGVTSATPGNQINSTSGMWQTGNTKVLPGDRIGISDGSHFVWLTVASVVSNTELTTTSDYTGGSFTPGASQTFRIERQINDVEIAPSFFTTNGNIVSLSGGVTLAVTNQGTHTVSYALVYEQYISLRQDLTELGTVESEADITSMIGRIDARNPLAAGAFVALENTTSIVQFIGVLTDDLQGHTTVRDTISGRADVYAIVPMTTDVSIFAMWNSDCVERALPDAVHGQPQRFRVVIGNGTLPISATIISPSATGQSVQVMSSSPGYITAITLTGVASLITGGVIPGDILNVTVTSAAGVVALGMYPIATVESAAAIQVNISTPFASAGTANITAEILEADGVTVRIASAALTGVVTAQDANLYLQLSDPSGTFVSSGVAAGDLVQIPADPNAAITSSSVFTSVVVASVLSNQRLLIVNNGQDSSTVVNELPHGVKRIGGALVTLTSINYQIVRTLSKDQQVTNLIALAQSFNSSRTILVWPDKCDVAGVTGGTKQPGYYLAAAVGGMTAGLPAQQGFTNLGIAGVSQIYDSNTYFSDTQMTDLSNGGWYVFAQQTPQSLPFTLHQLTTNPSTLQSGEFSVVKNFDFVSLFFVDILEDFLGQYNVTENTLTQLSAALTTGAQLLLLRTVAKIGAPLTSFAITSLGVSPTSGDTVLIYLAIGLPNPLNVIELFLVA